MKTIHKVWKICSARIVSVACLTLIAVLVGLTYVPHAFACTRAVYLGPENNLIITGRSMDWAEDMESNLWAFPSKVKQNGHAGAKSITWESKYASVGTGVWDIGIADGMNEKGLVANMLYLTETKFPTPTPTDSTLSLSLWPQYMLDNYATVEEAVAAMEPKPPFVVIPIKSPTGREGTVHLALSDATGDSAIFEYVDGNLMIHRSRDYQVVTNSPIFDQQLALNNYWEQIGGLTMLPGTNRATDRFVRASFYINAIPKTTDAKQAVASVFSVMRNASVPLGISTPERPEISSTIWRTVSDQTNKRYFFESARSPNVFWVNLKNLNFASLNEGEALKLTLTDGAVFAGNTAKKFEPVESLKFKPAEL